jgi:hypothetical protein
MPKFFNEMDIDVQVSLQGQANQWPFVVVSSFRKAH